MKLALAFLGATAVAFTAPQTTSTRAATQLCAYVPSGMDPAAYAALKKKEAAASKKSDRKAYKSRSFNSFVEATLLCVSRRLIINIVENLTYTNL